VERWKRIEGFENYEVSDQGRVRRAEPGANNTYVGKVLTSSYNQGYIETHLWKNGKLHSKKVHRLVAKAFLPNPLGLPEVNHKGPKSDNRASQLEWRTKKGNELDKVQRGIGKQGPHVGVSFDKGRYRARITLNHKATHLGYFYTLEEALQARKQAAKNLIYEI
jgi:hypothetical protein